MTARAGAHAAVTAARTPPRTRRPPRSRCARAAGDGRAARPRSGSIQSSPNCSRVTRSWCTSQRSTRSSAIACPPSCARASRWWASTLHVDPQISPFANLYWHRPPSRFQTSRSTLARTRSGFAGRSVACGFATSPFRFASRSRRRSSAASRMSAVEAPGFECESASRAWSSLERRRFGTVTCSRRNFAVSGSTRSRSSRGAGTLAGVAPVGGNASSSGEQQPPGIGSG